MVLCLPKIENPISFPSEILVQESIKYYNGKLVSGTGVIFYPNIFDNMNMKFSNSQNIEFEGKHIKEGELQISRSNFDFNIWDPIIMRYEIKMEKPPLSVIYTNETLKIKLRTRTYSIKSLKLEIFISKQDFRPHLNLFPQNLSHRVSFIENDIIKWEIETLHSGGEYSINFSKCPDHFKIERIESSYIVDDKLLSGLIISKCVIQSNNLTGKSKEFNPTIKFQSNIVESYFFHLK